MSRTKTTQQAPIIKEHESLKIHARVLMAMCLLFLLYATSGLAVAHVRYAEQLNQISCFQNIRYGVIPAPRGRIFDCKNRPLVDNRIVSSLFVNPSLVRNEQREELALALNLYFGCKLDSVRQTLSETGSKRRILLDEMTAIDLDRFNSLPDSGPIAELMREVGVMQRETRYYPLGPLASPVLGFTGIRDEGQVGLKGIEYRYNEVLTGRPGYYRDIRDQRGRRVPSTRFEIASPRVGTDLILTLDSDIQFLAESVLSAGMSETGAIGGAIVVTQPSSGNVLALASLPSLDPLNIAPYINDENAMFSRATSLSYEPGSAMKIFTAAATLEEGIVNPDTYLHVTTGKLRFHGGWVTDHEYPNSPDMSLRDVIVHSCNRGAAIMAVNLGSARMIAWLQKFGFGTRTALDFPGEPNGNLKESVVPLPEIDLADMGFGHGITASPLQLAQGIGVFANGGNLVPLRFVQARRDPICSEQVMLDPPNPDNVLSSATAATLQDFMIGVIEEGTAMQAQTAWTCAGKTGTAQKINPSGGYFNDRYFSTFAGYGPIPDPKYVIVIILDEPRFPYYGGTTCGPIFHRLFTSLMIRDGIPPERSLNGRTATVSNAGETDRTDSTETAANRNANIKETAEYVLTPNPFGREGHQD